MYVSVFIFSYFILGPATNEMENKNSVHFKYKSINPFLKQNSCSINAVLNAQKKKMFFCTQSQKFL